MAEKDILAQMAQHSFESDQLSDGDLIDAVVKEVWSTFSMTSRESWLLGRMVERFQELAGIEETPAGITVDGQPLWPDVVSED